MTAPVTICAIVGFALGWAHTASTLGPQLRISGDRASAYALLGGVWLALWFGGAALALGALWGGR